MLSEWARRRQTGVNVGLVWVQESWCIYTGRKWKRGREACIPKEGKVGEYTRVSFLDSSCLLFLPTKAERYVSTHNNSRVGFVFSGCLLTTILPNLILFLPSIIVFDYFGKIGDNLAEFLAREEILNGRL